MTSASSSMAFVLCYMPKKDGGGKTDRQRAVLAVRLSILMMDEVV